LHPEDHSVRIHPWCQSAAGSCLYLSISWSFTDLADTRPLAIRNISACDLRDTWMPSIAMEPTPCLTLKASNCAFVRSISIYLRALTAPAYRQSSLPGKHPRL